MAIGAIDIDTKTSNLAIYQSYKVLRCTHKRSRLISLLRLVHRYAPTPTGPTEGEDTK